MNTWCQTPIEATSSAYARVLQSPALVMWMCFPESAVLLEDTVESLFNSRAAFLYMTSLLLQECLNLAFFRLHCLVKKTTFNRRCPIAVGSFDENVSYDFQSGQVKLFELGFRLLTVVFNSSIIQESFIQLEKTRYLYDYLALFSAEYLEKDGLFLNHSKYKRYFSEDILELLRHMRLIIEYTAQLEELVNEYCRGHRNTLFDGTAISIPKVSILKGIISRVTPSVVCIKQGRMILRYETSCDAVRAVKNFRSALGLFNASGDLHNEVVPYGSQSSSSNYQHKDGIEYLPLFLYDYIKLPYKSETEIVKFVVCVWSKLRTARVFPLFMTASNYYFQLKTYFPQLGKIIDYLGSNFNDFLEVVKLYLQLPRMNLFEAVEAAKALGVKVSMPGSNIQIYCCNTRVYLEEKDSSEAIEELLLHLLSKFQITQLSERIVLPKNVFPNGDSMETLAEDAWLQIRLNYSRIWRESRLRKKRMLVDEHENPLLDIIFQPCGDCWVYANPVLFDSVKQLLEIFTEHGINFEDGLKSEYEFPVLTKASSIKSCMENFNLIILSPLTGFLALNILLQKELILEVEYRQLTKGLELRRSSLCLNCAENFRTDRSYFWTPSYDHPAADFGGRQRYGMFSKEDRLSEEIEKRTSFDTCVGRIPKLCANW